MIWSVELDWDYHDPKEDEVAAKAVFNAIRRFMLVQSIVPSSLSVKLIKWDSEGNPVIVERG